MAPEAAALALFGRAFGPCAADEPTIVARAPGRVNIIGEHTDYSGGFVMPAALDVETAVVARRRPGSRLCRVASTNVDDGRVAELTSDREPARSSDAPWANYVLGVIAEICKLLPDGEAVGFDAAFSSTVPLGGGLSSSASLEVATAAALARMCGLALSPAETALLAWRAESGFMGMPCGVMDQFVSAAAEPGCAMLLDCRSLATRAVRLRPRDAVLVIANSNIKHALTGSEYPDRVRQCADAAAALGVESLRDTTPAQVAGSALTGVLLKRARHVTTENERALAAADALDSGDLAEAGRLMRASHDSLRDDFEVSTPELDCLVDIASGLDGVYGARMTGGGFGGSIVALVAPEAVDGVCGALVEGYRRPGREATVLVGGGARGASARVLGESGAGRRRLRVAGMVGVFVGLSLCRW